MSCNLAPKTVTYGIIKEMVSIPVFITLPGITVRTEPECASKIYLVRIELIYYK